MFRQVKNRFPTKKSGGTKIQPFTNAASQADCGDNSSIDIDIGEYIDSTPPLTPSSGNEPTLMVEELSDVKSDFTQDAEVATAAS